MDRFTLGGCRSTSQVWPVRSWPKLWWRVLADQLEAGRLVDPPGRDQHAVGPERHPSVPRLTGELHAPARPAPHPARGRAASGRRAGSAAGRCRPRPPCRTRSRRARRRPPRSRPARGRGPARVAYRPTIPATSSSNVASQPNSRAVQLAVRQHHPAQVARLPQLADRHAHGSPSRLLTRLFQSCQSRRVPATATSPSARETELVELAYAYVLEHGLSDLSLRPLAAAIGSSPRVLLFLFGSKERSGPAAACARPAGRARLAGAASGSRCRARGHRPHRVDLADRPRPRRRAPDLVRGLRPLAGRARRPLGRLRPEHRRGLAGPPRRRAAAGRPAYGSGAGRAHPGTQHAAGALLDLLATGERTRVDAAVAAYAATLD